MNDQELRQHTNPVFRFLVEIDGDAKAVFTECSLPTVEWEIEEVKEGGLNVFTHQLPGRRKGSRVTLKNGVGKSSLVDWYIKTMSETFKRSSMTINLLDSQMKTIMTWQIEDVVPIKWTGPDLKSSESTIAIQTLELAGGEVTVS
jgi:phage tail-like protein